MFNISRLSKSSHVCRQLAVKLFNKIMLAELSCVTAFYTICPRHLSKSLAFFWTVWVSYFDLINFPFLHQFFRWRYTRWSTMCRCTVCVQCSSHSRGPTADLALRWASQWRPDGGSGRPSGEPRRLEHLRGGAWERWTQCGIYPAVGEAGHATKCRCSARFESQEDLFTRSKCTPIHTHTIIMLLARQY